MCIILKQWYMNFCSLPVPKIYKEMEEVVVIQESF